MVDRIQKLLCTEYQDFTDTVLLESLFAETTRDGNGIMQVQIGLTRTKLILACLLPEARDPWSKSPQAAELESLELLSLTPVDMVTLSVFRRRTRNTIKAHFSNDVIKYFELASPSRREMFWELWLEKVKTLKPEAVSSTQSETSVGSSSSAVTPALKLGYGTNNDCITWPMRDVYLGKRFGQGESRRKLLPSGSLHIPREIETELTPLKRRRFKTKVYPVNRFGSGVDERCCTSLYLPAQVYVTPNLDFPLRSYEYGADDWRGDSWMNPVPKPRALHPRRYGLLTLPHLLYGLGLWALSPGEAPVLQLRKTSSSIFLHTNRNKEMSPELPKRLLVSRVSHENLLRYEHQTSPYLLFWTPGYWYQPRCVKDSYTKLRRYIDTINKYIKDSNKKNTWFSRYPKINFERKKWRQSGGKNEESLLEKDVRRQLKMDINLTSWDFDSTLIAQEITILDREFFIRIPVHELLVLMRERNSRNTPNFRAMIAFSNRLVNLITTEVIRINSIKMRSRLIARWINVADKLYRLQNLQGSRSVLLGLQSPGVYRLKETWSYLRRYHNTKYRRLLTLLRLNMDPRSERYSETMRRVVKAVPFLPALEFLVAVLLGWTHPAPSITPTSPLEDVERLWRAWRQGAEGYFLNQTPLAKEFLTKARYLEEMENFILASKLEANPSTV